MILKETRSFHWFLSNSEVEATWISLIGWPHKTSTTYVHCTLYNVILRIARNFLETRENIKISTHPFYHINLDWFSWEWSKKNKKNLKKIIQNGRFKKTEFFKIANSQKNFVKISQIGPWVSRIDWCEGHWCGSMWGCPT